MDKNNLEQHLKSLWRVFGLLAARGHSLAVKKTHVLQEEVEYLGHISTPTGLRMPDRTKEAVAAMPYPLVDGEVDITKVRSFLGLVNWVKRYLSSVALKHGTNLGAVKAVLNRLTETSTNEKPCWNEECAQAWDMIKACVADASAIYPMRCSASVGGVVVMVECVSP